MDGQDLKDFTESILDESLDDVLFITLLNVAKDNIEDDGTHWQILQDIDTSKQSSPGDTYLTMKALPDNFRRPLSEIYIGSRCYTPIPFAKREFHKNGSGKFYIDYKSSQFAIIGAPGSTQTINFPYLTTTDELALNTSWIFPDRFHELLAFWVAGYYQMGVDADDIFARMSPENKAAARGIASNMRRWNSQLALHAINNSAEEELADEGISIGSL